MKSCMGKLYLELDYANNSPLCIAERDTKDFPQSLQHIDIDTILWSLEACESAYKFIIL